MLPHQIFIACGALLTGYSSAAPLPADDVPVTDPSPLPRYPPNLRDTSDHAYPFHLSVSSTSELYDGHNVQSCNSVPPASPPSYGSAPSIKSRDEDSADTGCVDPTLDSPVLAFEIRNGTLYVRDEDPSGYPDSYVDTGEIGQLVKASTAKSGTPDEYNTQSFVLSKSSEEAEFATDKWALQATGLQGQGLYQLVNEAWVGKTSPSGSPWGVGWQLCGPIEGEKKELRWYQTARTPAPVEKGCEIVALLVSCLNMICFIKVMR